MVENGSVDVETWRAFLEYSGLQHRSAFAALRTRIYTLLHTWPLRTCQVGSHEVAEPFRPAAPHRTASIPPLDPHKKRLTRAGVRLGTVAWFLLRMPYSHEVKDSGPLRLGMLL